ncbi:E3 ubiquitin-protein ligase RFWD3 [Toxorhynchites rutilus septentrionalis]|uniref:E3 ubiquitin-protein ligase RFWD3 n=1 Tax=Toxorhynchites rutilus septentrionalis TaxID=329112 RepID=UPI0024785BC6|nr:E3 ubiquitin-protein ligase RFWD3 [Toxorhynchites rutilus septentrionalis]
METSSADPNSSTESSDVFEEDLARGLETTISTISAAADDETTTESDGLSGGENMYGHYPSTASESTTQEFIPDEVALVIEQPTVNMEIELARVLPRFLSPVIMLNSNLVTDVVPEAQATIEIVDGGDDGGGSGVEETSAITTAITAAAMEGPIVLIEDTLRSGQDLLAGPSAVRNASTDSPRNRKRRRTNTPPKKATSPPANAEAQNVYDDDDDGTICSICLDSWTLTGEHRLVSLKCGHLFGYMCIKRWLQDNTVQNRCCATCKTKSTLRDIRPLYAKAVRAVDNTEELRLKEQVGEEKLKVSKLSGELQVARMELEVQRTVAAELRARLKEYEQRGVTDLRTNASLMGEISSISKAVTNYKIALDKTIDLCRSPGCRVMAYGSKRQHLLVSQKSTQNLFPGFSIKFLDVPTFQHSSILHVSSNMIRDISIDVEDELFTAATSERSVRLFSFSNRSIMSFTPSEANVWSCAFDRERSKFLYLGTQSGGIYVYDIRNNNQYVEEFRTEGDCSPIINICPVSSTDSIPFGGFLVCKLTSCWFFEYTAAQTIESTRLNLDGPFTAMNYCEKTGYIMITTRPNSRHPRSRYILANLVKLDLICALHIVQTIKGSTSEPNMIRSAQVRLDDNCTMIAAYQQDDRQLATWSSSRGTQRLQSLPISDTLWDLCPIYADDLTFLAALSDNKCRVYRAYSL